MRNLMRAIIGLAALAPGCHNVECVPASFEAPGAADRRDFDTSAPSYSSKAIPLEAVEEESAVQPVPHLARPRAAAPVHHDRETPTRPPEVREAIIDGRLRIYSASFALLVEDTAAAEKRAVAMAEELGGYLEKTSSKATVVRVPADRFRDAVAAIGVIGTITDKTIQVDDVTERFYDLRIRLQNAKALATRLRELLKKTEEIKQAVAIETKLKELQAEIDTLTGRMRLLANRIAYSRIVLAFTPTVSYEPPRLRLTLPFRWLDELGLNRLTRFNGDTLFNK